MWLLIYESRQHKFLTNVAFYIIWVCLFWDCSWCKRKTIDLLVLDHTSVMIASYGAGDVKTGGTRGEINWCTKWLSVEPCGCQCTSNTLLCCGSPVNNAGTLNEPYRCNSWEDIVSSGFLPMSLHLQSEHEEALKLALLAIWTLSSLLNFAPVFFVIQ